MESIPNWIELIAIVISSASAIAAITKTPKDDAAIAKIYKLLEICALNIGNAKK
tara:strand:+ start:1462 stop:1623 length:162 start_codon:yes stop_codon:yes gene_type:complete